MKKQLIAAAIAVALGSSVVTADDTSSSIRGQILTPEGQPAADVKVTVTHIPTGAVRNYSTNNAGSFVASGLRIGGPYKILIDSTDFQDEEFSDVFLELGNPLILKETLELVESGVVIVNANPNDYRLPNSGSSSTFSADQISGTPSFNRDLKDVLRRNPLVNVLDNDVSSLSVAGNNPRYNSLSVDGVRQDDDFGLNGSGYPTQRSPISIDSIDQISITTNPFSAKDGGFSGAKINVVTKSGTNDFDGTIYYEYADDKYAGPAIDNGTTVPTVFTERTLGFTAGGPIIEDELFFFASYEKYEEPGGVEGSPSDQASSSRADINTADTNEVIRIARDVYGVDAGDWNIPSTEEDVKKLIKLDWNINEFHRAAFSYQNTKGELTANNDGNRTLHLSSHWYTRGDELTAMSVQWFADWSNEFSTELRIATKESDNKQDPLLGKGIGEVRVTTPSGRVNLGADDSRHANELRNDNFQLLFTGEYLMDEHTISFGYVRDEIDAFNIFVADSLGSWVFDSLADFENRTASSLQYSNADSNNANDAAAEFEFATDTFYIEDTWDLSYNLNINFGLRFERISTNDSPRDNPNFEARYGFKNTATIDGESLVLPRFGFSWEAAEDLMVRGGFGKYSGGRPNVWLSNSYTNDGTTIVTFNPNDIADPTTYLENVDISQVPQVVQDTLAAGDGNATPIDPNFKLPTHWQYSLAADYVADFGPLGEGWLVNGEVIYKDIVKDVQWIDLARQQVGTTVEGRPIYGSFDPVTGNRDHYDLLLTNSTGGDSVITSLSLSKSFENGFDFNFAYTNQNVKDRVPGTSSTAESNYQFTTVVDRQNPGIATAAYEVEHRFAMNLDYSAEWFEGYRTRIGMFAERVSGRPFSWTLGAFRDRDLGDQSRFYGADSYLPYIPTDASDPAVDFGSGLSYDEIVAALAERGISSAGGGYLQRNAYRSPWKTNIDLAFSQEVPGFFDGQKGEVYLNIDNFLNFIDKSQGKIYSNRFGESSQILFDYDVNSAGQYVYREPFGGFRNGSPATFRSIESAWRIKIGVRYKF